MSEKETAQLFDAYYFAHGCGRPYQRDEHWLNFFDGIAEQIVQRINPKTVLDAGCAMGFLVEGLRKRGVDAYGIDISDFAIANVHENIKEFCRIGSVTEPFPQKYELIVIIEVLEHLTLPEAEKAVRNVCRFTEDVLFSSTPFDFKEASHFNVQPPEYWAEMFALQGFLRDIDFNGEFITPWTVRFRKKNETAARLVREYERKFFLLAKENSDLRALILENRDELRRLEQRLIEKEDEEIPSRVTELQDEIARKNVQIQESEGVVIKLEQQIMEAHKEIDDLKEQNERLEFEKLEYKNQLEDIFNSRSWGVMKKLQAVKLLFFPK